MSNPAQNPEWGPNRLFRDWPGSSDFQPPHLQELGKEMLEKAKEPEIESPENTNPLGRLGLHGYIKVIPES